jgi:hypothetical protein
MARKGAKGKESFLAVLAAWREDFHSGILDYGRIKWHAKAQRAQRGKENRFSWRSWRLGERIFPSSILDHKRINGTQRRKGRKGERKIGFLGGLGGLARGFSLRRIGSWENKWHAKGKRKK